MMRDLPEKPEALEDATGARDPFEELVNACLMLARSTQQLTDVVAMTIASKEEENADI